MQKIQRSGLFIFCNKGHGSNVLEYCIKNNKNVIGVCSGEKIKTNYLNKFLILFGLLLRKFNLRPPGGFVFSSPYENSQSVQKIAKKNNIPYFTLKDFNNLKLINFLDNTRPELILCCSFNKLIPKEIINKAKWHAINIHPGLLPQRGGGTPNRWAVLLGDKYIGVTAHIMSTQFDTGEIIFQERTLINNIITWGEAENLISPLILKVLKKILISFDHSINLITTSQNNQTNLMKSLKYNNLRIDWNKSGEDIKRICFAMKPKTGGRTLLNGKEVCIWDLELINNKDNEKIGKVLGKDKYGNPIIKTVDGALIITKLLYNYKIYSGKFLYDNKYIKKDNYFV